MHKTYTAIGMMSGTSLDGVDAAIVHSDGEDIFSLGPALGYSYNLQERQILQVALRVGSMLSNSMDRDHEIRQAEKLITRIHGDVVEDLLNQNSISCDDIDYIGFHGQTIFHAPQHRLTIQIGDGDALAKRCGIPVVYDFRSADVAAGGEGAPLAPVFHAALMRYLEVKLPASFLNIGGVANITNVDQNGNISAFDTGPGNALVDDWVRLHTELPFDQGGCLAQQGKVHEEILLQLLDHPYFSYPAPKSLDRNNFDSSLVGALSVEDGAATLSAFTVHSIVRALLEQSVKPGSLLVSGGGVHNAFLMDGLRAALPDIDVQSVNILGLSADFIEAQAFAYLAIRSLRKLPITFPGATGCFLPLVGGKITVHPVRSHGGGDQDIRQSHQSIRQDVHQKND